MSATSSPVQSISNQKARWIWLYSNGLSNAPTGSCNSSRVLSLIESLGLLQLDPIQVVARAHDHILWNRATQYRPSQLETLQHKHKGVFEHFSHDACLLPITTLPYWKRQFERRATRFERSNWGKELLEKNLQIDLIDRIKQCGPLASKDFKDLRLANPASGEVWSKPAHKIILDYLWLKGTLAVSHRKKFVKYYDLAANIYPDEIVQTSLSQHQQIHWLCDNALRKLGLANAGELMRFWEACELNEVKHWIETNPKRYTAVSVEVFSGGYSDSLLCSSLLPIIENPPEPTSRLRILNPFDPAIRDRNRLKRLFGFDYRIEMYTPADQRRYGYYVYPILEFDQLIGRIEVTFDKKHSVIRAKNLWLEPKIKLGKGRRALLEAELDRMRRFCNAHSVEYFF